MKQCRDHNGTFRWFIPINIAAALGHLLNVIATYFLASDEGRKVMYPVYQTYAEWTTKEAACSANMDLSESYEITNSSSGSLVVTPTKTAVVYELSLFWLIISFHLLSFVFQISIPVLDYIADRFNTRLGRGCHTEYVKGVLIEGVNMLRFVEYSVSASIMLVCLALISNILKLYSLIGLGVLTTATMLFGLVAEALFSDGYLQDIQDTVEVEMPKQLFRRATFNNEFKTHAQPVEEFTFKTGTKDSLAISLRRLGWIAHFAGWITMGAAYGGILIQHFFWSVQKSEEANPNGPSTPDFVRVLILSLAVLYNIFGFTQLFQLCAKDPWLGVWTGRRYKLPGLKYASESRGAGFDGKKISCCRVSLNEGVERFYVFNSLLTKTLLGWTIISQLLSEDQGIGTNVTC